MTTLTIVDLHQADELSSSSMGRIAGGVDCEVATKLADANWTFGNIFTGMGDKDTANVYYGYSLGLRAGAC
jgi:hypothetical protein